ncbi:MAG TPA: LptE family protein, partial [Flavisolibacter sp.]|nr:LptE family protein [Flavisolibacter sp.]
MSDSAKTVRVTQFENKAPYVNPAVSPALTERLRQKILNQTKLTNTNNDNADYNIIGYVADYSVSTTGVTSNNGQQQSSINRLTVRVHISLSKFGNTPEEFDVSRSFD